MGRAPSETGVSGRRRLCPGTAAFCLRLALIMPLAAGLDLLLTAPRAMADEAPLALTLAWVRAMPPGQSMTAAYLQITNPGATPVIIEGIRSPLGQASLHQTVLEDGQSRMRPVQSLTVAPSEHLAMEPGGLHVMLTGLEAQPGVGESTPLCLLTSVGEICVDAIVQRGPSDVAGGHTHH